MIDAHNCKNVAEPSWLAWDATEFNRSFGKQPFVIEHQLSDHPLFEMERLLKLARTLPACQIEYNAGKIPVAVSHEQTPANGLSAEETIRRIAECESWLVLKYIEKDPEYQQLLNDCLAQLHPLTEQLAPGMMKPHAFVFVTSPGSVTPLHIDPEHNFLLQIRGAKKVRMFDGHDPAILAPAELEQFYSDRGRNLTLKPEHADSGWTHLLNPGQGLHFPVTFPHWVENQDEISISFSITFRTPDLDKRRALYRTNCRLRAVGLQPQTPGKSRIRDTAFYQTYRTLRKINRVIGRDSEK